MEMSVPELSAAEREASETTQLWSNFHSKFNKLALASNQKRHLSIRIRDTKMRHQRALLQQQDSFYMSISHSLCVLENMYNTIAAYTHNLMLEMHDLMVDLGEVPGPRLITDTEPYPTANENDIDNTMVFL